METRNHHFPIPQHETNPLRSWRRSPALAGPLGLVGSRATQGVFRMLLWQAAAVGLVAASIVLDAILRPSPGVELAWQVGAFLAALILSWQGLARFIPELDRRWRIRKRMF